MLTYMQIVGEIFSVQFTKKLQVTDTVQNTYITDIGQITEKHPYNTSQLAVRYL